MKQPFAKRLLVMLGNIPAIEFIVGILGIVAALAAVIWTWPHE